MTLFLSIANIAYTGRRNKAEIVGQNSLNFSHGIRQKIKIGIRPKNMHYWNKAESSG